MFRKLSNCTFSLSLLGVAVALDNKQLGRNKNKLINSEKYLSKISISVSTDENLQKVTYIV